MCDCVWNRAHDAVRRVPRRISYLKRCGSVNVSMQKLFGPFNATARAIAVEVEVGNGNRYKRMKAEIP